MNVLVNYRKYVMKYMEKEGTLYTKTCSPNHSPYFCQAAFELSELFHVQQRLTVYHSQQHLYKKGGTD